MDESILAASLFTKQFHMVENTVRPSFVEHFKLSRATEDSGPAYAAAICGIANLVKDSFGEIEKITVDYGRAKLMFIVLKNDAGYVGLVLSRAVNGDYLAVRIETELDGKPNEVDVLI